MKDLLKLKVLFFIPSGGSGEPPEKFVKYLARHEYKLEIEFTTSEKAGYLTAVSQSVTRYFAEICIESGFTNFLVTIWLNDQIW